ncbi:acetyl-CoA carboxylase [Verticillium alfalfae VaMs.102]|uniref:Acetyl-CoA carboxylase n=1 Tax=Verticillium alfalfae (strain VaMs.102 / ATCC MYA-4576 / FGSC 10136) TaxID=526221 RepID=C9SEQ4_VERA1|nr:acetyl-CoA carboxylase [Verticillium alfalfae VaMs.102]EEY16647.1 acetyl-CoA carboxylase [Verticillium alfalfae VaMs.102]
MATNVLSSPFNGEQRGGAEETRQRNLSLLESWSGVINFGTADPEASEWYEANRKTITDRIESLKTESFANELTALLRANKSIGMKGVRDALRVMPPEERDSILKYLRE